MKTSMLKTLACKHDSTVTKMADRYKTTIDEPGDAMRWTPGTSGWTFFQEKYTHPKIAARRWSGVVGLAPGR